MYSYQQIAYFCEIYRHGSLSKAADELFLTRQALGKSLSALEKELGGALFIRRSDGIQATDLARQLYPEALRLREDAEHVFEKMRAAALNTKIPLCIGSTFSALETTLPLLPIEFARKYPNVELSISEHPDLEIEELVSTGEFDGGLVLGPATPRRDIESRCVHLEKLGMLMRKDHPLANRDVLRIDDLGNVPLLLIGEGFKVRRQLLDKFDEAGVEPRIAYSSSDFSLLAKMAEMGQGIAPLPVSRKGIFDGQILTVVPFDDASDPGWQIDFIWRGQDEVSYALAAFMDCLFAVE